MENERAFEEGKLGTQYDKKVGVFLLYDVKVIGSFALAFIFFCLGFYKLLSYSNGELGEPVNAYVGGDAYNYIINAGQSTAYFVVTLIFVVLGCAFFISNHLLLKGRESQ